MPYESWCPAVSENVVFFYAIIFKTQFIAAQSLQNCGVTKNKHALNKKFQAKSSWEKFQNWI